VTDQRFAAGQDTAQQVVTALLNEDRDLAGDLAEAFPDPLALALVLADLTAYIHHAWAAAAGIDRTEAWQFILGQVEHWRVTNGRTSE
jgi:hypothetical protein